MSIAENIKRIRKNMNLTQKELADRADIAVITLQQYELGKRMPRKKQLEQLAAALHVNENQLLVTASTEADIFSELLALTGWEITTFSGCEKNAECPLSESEYIEMISGGKIPEICESCDYPNKNDYYISNGKMYYKIEKTDLETLENCVKPYLELRIKELVAKKDYFTTKEFLRREYGEK